MRRRRWTASLEDYDVCPAGNYEELGRFSLQRLKVPEDVLSHVDLDELGHFFEDRHPVCSSVTAMWLSEAVQSSHPVGEWGSLTLG